jgi:hypothetical protein
MIEKEKQYYAGFTPSTLLTTYSTSYQPHALSFGDNVIGSPLTTLQARLEMLERRVQIDEKEKAALREELQGLRKQCSQHQHHSTTAGNNKLPGYLRPRFCTVGSHGWGRDIHVTNISSPSSSATATSSSPQKKQKPHEVPPL